MSLTLPHNAAVVNSIERRQNCALYASWFQIGFRTKMQLQQQRGALTGDAFLDKEAH